MCPEVRCPSVRSDCETIEYIVFQYDYEVRGRVINVRCESCEYCLDPPFHAASFSRRRRTTRQLANRSNTPVSFDISFCIGGKVIIEINAAWISRRSGRRCPHRVASSGYSFTGHCSGGRVGQNFCWMGHSAFCPFSSWPVCSSMLSKISKIGATSCHILRLKCTRGRDGRKRGRERKGKREGRGQDVDLAHPKILAWRPLCRRVAGSIVSLEVDRNRISVITLLGLSNDLES